MKRPVLAFALVAALAGAIAWVPGEPGGAHAANGEPTTLRAAFETFPDYMDPQLSYTTAGWTAMYDTYIPLLTYRRASGREGAEVIPGLAKDLPRVSNDGRSYTLFLRKGLKYSDGTPVRASDFEYAIKRLFKLFSGGSPFYTAIVGARRFEKRGRGGISGIVTDNKTGRITIRLVRPSGTFADLLALPFAALVPPSTPMRDQSFNPPPATGPYAIANADPGERWSYERNPAWASSNGRRMPQLPDGHVDRIAVRVIPDAHAQIRGVEGGRLDWMQAQPPPSRLLELQRRFGGTQFRVEPTLSTYHFWMNAKRAPFDDVRVRRAVNHAVDRSVLRRIYRGQVAPSQQILPPGMPGYRGFALYPHDLAKARSLIAAADPSDREVTVWVDSELLNRRAAAYYRAQLEKIGFRARLKSIGSAGYFLAVADRSTRDLDTGWAAWFADYAHPDDFFRSLLLGSPSSGNFSRTSAPALEAEVERLSKGRLNPRRERDYAALDRAYMKLAPWVPFGSSTPSTFVSQAVDLDRVTRNPLIGPALTSFRFR